MRNRYRQDFRQMALLAILLLGVLFMSAAMAGQVLNDALANRPFRHLIWQEVLAQHINASSQLDFVSLRANPRRLNQYLEQLAQVSPETDPDAFPLAEERLAYWINAHNALALRMVLDRYPLDSLAELSGFETQAWYRLGGRPYSLAAVREKALALAQSALPPVVFAVTDYTMEAPPIFPQAYEGASLDLQLKAAAQLTLASPSVVRFHRDNPACVGLDLSAFWLRYQKKDLLPEDVKALLGDRSGASGFVMENIVENTDKLESRSAKSATMSDADWLTYWRPFAPPDIYADLGASCRHPVRILSPDKTLRQVNAD